WRGSSSTRSMAKLPDTLDKQQERTAGHSLKNNSFRKSLQRAADNQSPNQIRQLYSSIRFKKTVSDRLFSISSEGDLPYIPTVEHKNNNTTRSRKDKHNGRCSQQIVYVRRLSPLPIISRLKQNETEHPINFRSIGSINNKTIISICDSERKGLTGPMDRCILQHMDERSPISICSNSNFIKSDFISQQRGDFSNSNSAMVAGPAMVYKLNESIKNVRYPWTVKPMHNQVTRLGKSKKCFTIWTGSSIPHGPEVEKDQRRISQLLNTILCEIGIRGATAYSFKHATLSELARYGLTFSSSQEVTIKALQHKPSRNKDVEQLNEVKQVHYQDFIQTLWYVQTIRLLEQLECKRIGTLKKV
ncbi:MAG: hypothetical protein EZS28_024184, partial [Streblomastix strix]